MNVDDIALAVATPANLYCRRPAGPATLQLPRNRLLSISLRAPLACVVRLIPDMRELETSQRDPDTYSIIGAAMEVHRILGCGFLEGVYKAAMLVELRARGIPVESEVAFQVRYKDCLLPLGYRADLVCLSNVIVEVKAARDPGPVDEAQAINYLRASGFRRALLLNFGGTEPDPQALHLRVLNCGLCNLWFHISV